MTITSLPSGSCFLENIPDIDILTAKTRLLVTIGDTAFSHTQKEKRLPTLTSKQPRNQNIKKT